MLWTVLGFLAPRPLSIDFFPFFAKNEVGSASFYLRFIFILLLYRSTYLSLSLFTLGAPKSSRRRSRSAWTLITILFGRQVCVCVCLFVVCSSSPSSLHFHCLPPTHHWPLIERSEWRKWKRRQFFPLFFMDHLRQQQQFRAAVIIIPYECEWEGHSASFSVAFPAAWLIGPLSPSSSSFPLVWFGLVCLCCFQCVHLGGDRSCRFSSFAFHSPSFPRSFPLVASNLQFAWRPILSSHF